MDLPVPPDDLPQRLREADTEELLRLVRKYGDRLEVVALRQIFRNPFASREVILEIAGQRKLRAVYEVRRDLARHAQTPQELALSLVPGLYWRDLMELGLDVRVRPLIRRATDRYLSERLPSMAAGEKMVIARRGGHGALMRLRHDPSPRVIGAMLENPRLTESILAPLVRSQTTAPPILALVAADRRWGVRYDMRVGLSRNPRTPVPSALKILPHLKKLDLKAVVAQRMLPAAVRQRARLLLGGG